MRSCKQLRSFCDCTILGSESLSANEIKALESRYRFGLSPSFMGIDSTSRMSSGRRLINVKESSVVY